MEHKEMQVTNPQQDGQIYTEQPDKKKKKIELGKS